MRRFTFSIIATLVLSVLGVQLRAQEATLADRIAALPQVKDVQELESTQFAEKYLVIFEQPIDHENPDMGTFTQRVYVCAVHPDSATVVVTEGYGAQYAASPRYRDEISALFNTNNIVVEHRYFLESTPYPGKSPEEVNWDYMNAPNAAADLHEVVTALKNVFDGKWISTGISKGGQTTMLYRVGTPADREAVRNFQIELLLRKDRLMPMYDSLCKAREYEFRAPVDEIYDYGVLEFSFAFWQWGYPVSEIPGKDASDREVFDYMMKISSPDYFVKWSATSPFFVQAATELGYYGYDMKQFKKYSKYFSIKNTKDYMQKLLLPQNREFPFSDYLYNKISAFLLSTDARMLFIYGQFDPWSAVMPADPHKDNINFFIQPGGSHRARIATFDEATQKEIKSILSQWLYE